MARFDIIDAKTGSVKYSGAPRYNGTYCKVSYLEFSEICSDSLISWNIGDYIVYPRTGLTYRLFDIPQPKKRSYRSEYGGAYVYSNVQFFADTKWLEIEPFRDIVPVDNKIHFTTQSSWSVWTNVEGLIARLNAVMQAAHPDEWEFRLVNAPEDSELYKMLHDEYLDFTVSGESVLDGLGKIYDSFGNIGWIHSVEDGKNIITVGISPIYQDIGDFTEVYRYGAGRGLTEIRKSVTNKNELKTRLYAYGSTRNMIPRYYNELTPAIKDADSVNIPNLMLPLSKWGMTNGKRDASKAFVERNVSKYGLRPDTVYFDGSDGNKDIYPSIEGTTIGDLYDAMAEGEAYRPDLAKHNRSVRLDAVESVRGIVDDGIESDSGAKYVDTILIPVSANSGDYKENFEISLFSGVQAPMSGKVTIPLSGITIIGTSESAPYYLNYRATITVAGRNYVTDIYNPELAASIKFSLEDVEVECSEGDEISATISCVRDNSATATHIEINQATLVAGIASKKDNSIVITIPQIGFDISTRAALGSQGIATISMKDGMCGGRSFVVKSCVYFESTDSWELTLYRGRDESLGMLFPNTTYPISAGDHFVLLDIAMPDTYVGMAEQRLLTAANELLESVSEQKPFYELSVDAKYMIENNRTLLEGRYMRLSDTDMISDVEYVLIDTVIINESESSIPTYRVTLREKKRVSYSNSQSYGDSLTSLASGGGLIESGLTPKQKKILSCFDIDDEGDIYTKPDENGRDRGLYTPSFLSSGGKSDTPGTGGGTVVGANIDGVEVPLSDGILAFPPYPTAKSLGLKSLAFVDSLAIADVTGLQSTLDGKQAVISDLATIRANANEGHNAYEGLSVVSAVLQSLQSQIDSVANRNDFDEINASAVFADNLSARRVLTGEFIQIGNAVISWDAEHDCLKVDKGLYSTSFLSSAGFSDTGGAGGGTVVGATVGGKEVTLSGGILEFDAYPTTTSLGLKNLAFKDSLAVAEIAGLQSALDGKQAVISDLTTIRANASNGNIAYNDLTTVSAILQSLQAQIDSLAGVKGDEVIATVVSTDIVTAQNAYIAVMHGSLDGNAATATNATYAAYDNSGEHIADNFSKVGAALKSLQSQIDSVASRDYAELSETLLSLKLWIEDMFTLTSSGIRTKYNFYTEGNLASGKA